jgi:hypothetical protein
MLWGDKWASLGGAPMIVTNAGGERAVAVTVETRAGTRVDQKGARFEPGPAARPATRAYLRALAAKRTPAGAVTVRPRRRPKASP